MNAKNIFISAISSLALPTFLAGALAISSVAQANGNTSSSSDYEELSYDELLSKLSSKSRTNINRSYSAFDDIKIHAGIGYINSFADIKTNKGILRRHQNGLQLATGMELFSPEWYSEVSFKNFGVTSGESDEITLRELDLKIGYKNQVQRPWSFIINSGLSNRSLKYKDLKSNESFQTITPSMIVGLGISAAVSNSLTFDFEMNGKSPIVSETNDRGSYDFTLRMNAVL